jgi:hypothetical protein
MSLTADQVHQLQSGLQGVTGLGVSGVPAGTGYGMYQTAPARPQAGQTKQQAQQQAQRIESMKSEWGNIVNNLTQTQAAGTGAQSTAIWLARIAGGLPTGDASKLIGKLPQNLQTLVNQYIANPPSAGPAGTAAGAKPAYDPLALQTMWHDVFGPIFNQTSKMAGAAGGDYMSAMNQAIAGSNLPASEQKQLTAQSGATGALLNQLAAQQTRSVATQPAYDQMIYNLQQAAAAAAAAQGEYEKYYGATQTAAQAPYLLGTATGTPGTTAPIDLSKLINPGAVP